MDICYLHNLNFGSWSEAISLKNFMKIYRNLILMFTKCDFGLLLSIVQLNCLTEMLIIGFDYGVRELLVLLHDLSQLIDALWRRYRLFSVFGTFLHIYVKTKYSSSYLHQLCKCMWWRYSNEHVYETRATTILECSEMLS